ncbi:DUF2528 family protein [Hydrogenophaga taeniospiralis]|uniref:DUF2528 family protein n=1 Tax=Hydrogenophaga taeniospiralis TaxID=65656 RepID=UPI001CFA92B8|nr:DUF2528 family protein [Hydrogenophaga taeniospiralis]UCU93981.1 DUF2528 family protein [Hydrogenophaga taeniospiralis]
MNIVKNFQVTSDDDFHQVCLRVDTAVLTPEMATQINTFWGGSEDRLDDQGGDVVLAVIRLFGAQCIRHLLEDGGAEFASNDAGQQQRITQGVLNAEGEGWPDLESLGILVTSADVYVPEFNSVTLQELHS